jgi:4-hydroxythreonine-4-phosphate dehydrogenase
MPGLLILADDLSGAADCGVAFKGAGLDTIVALGDVAGEAHCDVLSIDADTRCLVEELATDTVARLVRKHACRRDLLLFKKIDSTLRGHVAAELAAMLDAYRGLDTGGDGVVAVLAPAFPSSGRTTVNGLQLVHGDPLHQHEIWQLQGLTHRPDLPEMLQKAGLISALLPLDIIRSSGLSDAMSLPAHHVDVLVCDAETDADLEAIAHASMKLRQKVIWVGSAGLAYHLPQAMGLRSASVTAQRELLPLSGPLLFVIGSMARRSYEQIRVLTSSPEALHITVPPDILLQGAGTARWQNYERELAAAIAMDRDVVLSPGAGFQVAMADRQRLSASLARTTSSVSGRIGGLIAAGGETARVLLQGWGITGLRLRGELERGVPFSVTENWVRQLPVITKAGDFGSPETLLRCAQFLHSGTREAYS